MSTRIKALRITLLVAVVAIVLFVPKLMDSWESYWRGLSNQSSGDCFQYFPGAAEIVARNPKEAPLNTWMPYTGLCVSIAYSAPLTLKYKVIHNCLPEEAYQEVLLVFRVCETDPATHTLLYIGPEESWGKYPMYYPPESSK